MADGEEKASPGSVQDGLRIDPEIFLAICIIAGIVFGWIGLARSLPASLVAALMFGILALVTGDIVWSLDYRRAKAEAEDDETIESIGKEEARFNRIHRPLTILIGSLAFLILTIWVIISKSAPVPDWSNWAWTALILNIVFGVLLWWVGPKITTSVPSEEGMEGQGNITGWLRLSAIVLWLSVPSYLASTAANPESNLVTLFWFGRLAGLLEAIACLELLIRSSWSLISPRSQILPQAPVPVLPGSALRMIGLPVSRSGGKPGRIIDRPEMRFAWLGIFFRRSLPRIVLGLVTIIWLATSITQVGISEQGVRERFGAFNGDVLEPGIHVGYPWPIDRVRRFPAKKLQVMEIGFTTEGTRMQTDLIWTESHGIQEDRFVTNSGSEVISFDVELYYQISDIQEYAYTCLNPETMLKDIAYKAIMLRTHATRTEELLGRDRAALAQDLKEDIQAGCDAEEIGIEVKQVAIIAIHPPFEVAGAYQAVVSAQVYKETLGIQASTYKTEIIPSKQAEAYELEYAASAYMEERIAVATGEAEGFIYLLEKAEPEFDLYRFRRRMEVLEIGLYGKRLYIVNRRFLGSEEGEDRGLWFDLR